MFEDALKLINEAQKILIVQAENPDGDSLGSSLALEELLSDQGKDVILYCAIDLPKYLRYIKGWDRVIKDWPKKFDLAIIVDTASKLLLQQVLDIPEARNVLETRPALVIDHHQDEKGDLPFDYTILNVPEAVATSEIIYEMSNVAGWKINPQAAENLFLSIQADSLGLTTQGTTARSYQVATDLVALGAVPADIEARRREYMKKPADILTYKGELLQRIEYHLEGILATVHITWDDISKYSDKYNPSVLVLDEMRLVDTVQVAVAIKTYPDGKLTGKIRSNLPISHVVAGFFGGGGHAYAAGFKVRADYDVIIKELLTATEKAVKEYESTIS